MVQAVTPHRPNDPSCRGGTGNATCHRSSPQQQCIARLDKDRRRLHWRNVAEDPQWRDMFRRYRGRSRNIERASHRCHPDIRDSSSRTPRTARTASTRTIRTPRTPRTPRAPRTTQRQSFILEREPRSSEDGV